MYVERNIEERSRNHFCRGKTVSIKYSECVSLVLVIQHAKGMRRIILSCVASTALPYFSHYLIDDTIFEGGGGVVERKMCFDLLYNFCLKYL
jgi:hypothetical protein